MAALMGLMGLLIVSLLTCDWLIKRGRIRRRADVSDQSFLDAFNGDREGITEKEILELRRKVAKELGLTASKLSPDDDLIQLRDKYCLAVSGYLALGDLFADLEAEARGVGVARLRSYPATVGEYIEAFLGYATRRASSHNSNIAS